MLRPPRRRAGQETSLLPCPRVESSAAAGGMADRRPAGTLALPGGHYGPRRGPACGRTGATAELLQQLCGRISRNQRHRSVLMLRNVRNAGFVRPAAGCWCAAGGHRAQELPTCKSPRSCGSGRGTRPPPPVEAVNPAHPAAHRAARTSITPHSGICTGAVGVRATTGGGEPRAPRSCVPRPSRTWPG